MLQILKISAHCDKKRFDEFVNGLLKDGLEEKLLACAGGDATIVTNCRTSINAERVPPSLSSQETLSERVSG